MDDRDDWYAPADRLEADEREHAEEVRPMTDSIILLARLSGQMSAWRDRQMRHAREATYPLQRTMHVRGARINNHAAILYLRDAKRWLAELLDERDNLRWELTRAEQELRGIER